MHRHVPSPLGLSAKTDLLHNTHTAGRQTAAARGTRQERAQTSLLEAVAQDFVTTTSKATQRRPLAWIQLHNGARTN
eukprot:14437932-Heterocapsa_arctica.AAC.1